MSAPIAVETVGRRAPSSNLVIAGIAGERGVDVAMLSFAAVALPVALVGAVVIYVTSPRVLPGALDTTAPSKD